MPCPRVELFASISGQHQQFQGFSIGAVKRSRALGYGRSRVFLGMSNECCSLLWSAEFATDVALVVGDAVTGTTAADQRNNRGRTSAALSSHR
jgi:hypothetical protein